MKYVLIFLSVLFPSLAFGACEEFIRGDMDEDASITCSSMIGEDDDLLASCVFFDDDCPTNMDRADVDDDGDVDSDDYWLFRTAYGYYPSSGTTGFSDEIMDLLEPDVDLIPYPNSSDGEGYDPTFDSLNSCPVDLVPNGTAPNFKRGDTNTDTYVNSSDLSAWYTCYMGYTCPSEMDAMDVNDDGSITSADYSYLSAYLYTSGPAPPAPFATAGRDPTLDTINPTRTKPGTTSETITVDGSNDSGTATEQIRLRSNTQSYTNWNSTDSYTFNEWLDHDTSGMADFEKSLCSPTTLIASGVEYRATFTTPAPRWTVSELMRIRGPNAATQEMTGSEVMFTIPSAAVEITSMSAEGASHCTPCTNLATSSFIVAGWPEVHITLSYNGGSGSKMITSGFTNNLFPGKVGDAYGWKYHHCYTTGYTTCSGCLGGTVWESGTWVHDSERNDSAGGGIWPYALNVEEWDDALPLGYECIYHDYEPEYWEYEGATNAVSVDITTLLDYASGAGLDMDIQNTSDYIEIDMINITPLVIILLTANDHTSFGHEPFKENVITFQYSIPNVTTDCIKWW